MATKTALVIGASRGIGRQIALTFANNGYNVCVAAKTTEKSEKLPGTVYSVAAEIEKLGGNALPLKCNARELTEVRQTVQTCIKTFGSLDVAVYNAGAVIWDKVANTSMKKFDLLLDVNLRGAYTMVDELLPYYKVRRSGKFIMVSPPIYSRFFNGKTPYAISKLGVSILVQGLARELTDSGICISALWPATGIKSHVTDVGGVDSKLLRKSTIFADACLKIAEEKNSRLNGQCLIDEDYLRSVGVTDFSEYRCHPDHEPPRMMPVNFPSLKVEEEDVNVPPVFSKL